MKIGILFLFVYGVVSDYGFGSSYSLALGDYGFGSSYLKDSLLCRPWTCINRKLGLEDSLPTKETFTGILKNHLPGGAWQDVVDKVLEVCYSKEKPRRYTNTCPGQALLHCVVDNLIGYCPEESLNKEDACAPLSSLAGFKYMFSQSRYDNLQEYLPHEQRPEWFLKNYFSSNCCDVPALFDAKDLSECGFDSIIHYYGHEPKKSPARSTNANFLFVPTQASVPDYTDTTEQVTENGTDDLDPLACCDMTDFIPPAYRSECNFHLSWDDQSRLSIYEDPSVSTTTEKPHEVKLKHHDVKVVPLSQLNIVSDNGTVDKDAFSKLLDEFINERPNWRSAKARVVTRCLTKPTTGYEADCEINKILACTFDVLTENCPHTKKTVDPCKHLFAMKNDTICLINSSKYFVQIVHSLFTSMLIENVSYVLDIEHLSEKNRRQYCDFPQIVPHDVLTQCKVLSINRIESSPHLVPTKRKHSWMSYKPMCKETTPSASCLMSKMGILSRYNFMDYFKMKNRLKNFTSSHIEWSTLTDMYTSTLLGMPMYTGHCSSQRKLLNVLDSMLMTCPVPKRKKSSTCNKLFNSMTKNAGNLQTTQEKHDQLFSSVEHNFMMRAPTANDLNIATPKTPKLKAMMFPNKGESIFYNPLFVQRNIPKLQIRPIPPTPMRPKHKDILIITPVYLRSTIKTPELMKPEKHNAEPKGILFSRPFNHDGLFRSSHGQSPWTLHNQIANAHTSTTEASMQGTFEHISPLTLKGDRTF